MEAPGKKKWKVWLSGTVVFLVVLALIIAGIVLLSSTKDTLSKTVVLPLRQPIELNDIMQGKLVPNRFNATWVSDYELLFPDAQQNLFLYNVKTKKGRVLLTKDSQLLAASFDQQMSADKKYLLLSFSYRKLYRHSYTAQYLAYNIETGEKIPISPDINETFLELALWGPQGNSLAFVAGNNIYYRSNVTAPSIKVSHDGRPSAIYNGVPDWVYEEEVFGSNRAIWFSEDGSHLAYATFNDTLTRIMAIPFYGPANDPDSQYTRALTVRYPKAGTSNPTAGVVLVNLSGTTSSAILPVPESLSEPILASVSFATNSSVAVVWTNRVQNESITVLCEMACRQIFLYEETHGWVDMLRPLIFTANGDSFFSILPKRIGSDSWRQIAQINRGKVASEQWTPKFITNVPKTVTELMHWDEDLQTLWYMATSEEDSAYLHLYSVTLDGTISCFTCNISHSSGSPCLYNEVEMSKSGTHIAVSCLGPQVPEVYLYNKNGKRLNLWEKNEKVAEIVSEKDVPVIRRFKIQLADSSLPPAQVLLMSPPNADLSGAVKYPMLVNVYGGPDSYQVLERWNVDWGASLVVRWNITLALIDGRGTGLKGNNNLFSGYRNLGTVEITDQINATRHLQKSLGYIDRNRTCIWGWSYGGYASALALARGGDTFRCAISVAPVTDWAFYDSIYTERYMGLPNAADNRKGYHAAQLNNPDTAEALRNKKFMLVHGTLDDNVHFQQSMMFSRILQQSDILFTQLSYPDEDHGLNGVKHHLYHSIEQFLQTNLMSET